MTESQIHLDASNPMSPLLSFETDGLSGKVDLSKVSRLVIDYRPGTTVPVLILEVPFAGVLDIPVAQVVEHTTVPGEPVDLLTQLREFFDQLDPAMIESEVLAQGEDFSKSQGQCILDAFQHMVRERGNDSRT